MGRCRQTWSTASFQPAGGPTPSKEKLSLVKVTCSADPGISAVAVAVAVVMAAVTVAAGGADAAPFRCPR